MPDAKLSLGYGSLPHGRRNGGQNFYFFDLDDNILNLPTEVIFFHRTTGESITISTDELAREEDRVGKFGKYLEFRVDRDPVTGSFQNFRDQRLSCISRLRGKKQPLIHDIEAILRQPDTKWQAPSWCVFAKAVAEHHPISIITARGHRPQTVVRALKQLYRAGKLSRHPNIIAIYPVTNPKLRRQLLDDQQEVETIAELKRRALFHVVEQAFKKYGPNPHHRFGVSDDDPRNVQQLGQALVVLKRRYPNNAFFMIDCSGSTVSKVEILSPPNS